MRSRQVHRRDRRLPRHVGAGVAKALLGKDVLPDDLPFVTGSIGLRGIRVDSPDAVGPAWEQARLADRPVVVEAVTDPNVPPLPPHITFEQAKSFAKSIFKGDPDAFGVIRQSFKDLVEQYLPNKEK